MFSVCVFSPQLYQPAWLCQAHISKSSDHSKQISVCPAQVFAGSDTTRRQLTDNQRFNLDETSTQKSVM